MKRPPLRAKLGKGRGLKPHQGRTESGLHDGRHRGPEVATLVENSIQALSSSSFSGITYLGKFSTLHIVFSR